MKVLRERFYKSETLLTSVPNNEFVSHRRSADCANSNFDRFRNRERYRSRYRKRYSLPISEAIDFRLLDLSSETLSLENWNGTTPGAFSPELLWFTQICNIVWASPSCQLCSQIRRISCKQPWHSNWAYISNRNNRRVCYWTIPDSNTKWHEQTVWSARRNTRSMLRLQQSPWSSWDFHPSLQNLVTVID